MSPRHLKSLIESGHYRPEPSVVAEAMLQRRGIRELLTDTVMAADSAGRNRRTAPGVPRPS